MSRATSAKGRPLLSRTLASVSLIATVATIVGIGTVGSDRWVAKGYVAGQSADTWSRTESARTASISTEAGDEAYWLTAPRAVAVVPAALVEGGSAALIVGNRITSDTVGSKNSGSKASSAIFEVIAVTPISADIRTPSGDGTVVFVAARRVGTDGKLTGRTIRFLAHAPLAVDDSKSL